MEFEWDPAKNETNLVKHGISFLAASRVFEDPDAFEADRTRPGNGEMRMKSVGMVDGRLFAVIYTIRGTNRRIISARRARTNERRAYRTRKESR